MEDDRLHHLHPVLDRLNFQESETTMMDDHDLTNDKCLLSNSNSCSSTTRTSTRRRKNAFTKTFSRTKFSSAYLPLLLVLCSLSILLSCVDGASKKGEKRVVCYYTNWSAYRQGPAKFLPDNINPYLCTHLVYAFGGLTIETGIKPFDKYQDIDKGGYTKFNGLKTYNKALKTLIAIGGWNEGSRRFSSLVAEPEKRKNFIKHAIRFLRQYQFDGLDLDWEYPASREGGVAEDKKNYALFIKELREAFEDESKSTGRSRLLLTVAVPAGIEWITKGFDIPVINRNIDFFNLLTYDYHASTEPNANHHAPLKARTGISEYDWKGQLNIEYTINHYLKEGADPDKLVVGLPTYGRSYTLFNTESYDVDAPSSGPGVKGKFTKEPGYLAYYEVCEGVKSGEWRVENGDSDVQGPHAVKGDQWVGYDDERIMAIKAKWVKDNGLGGIMFWSLDVDDFRGTCHGKPFPLIEAAKVAYLTGNAPATNSKLSSKSTSRFSTTSLSKNRLSPTTTPTPPKTTIGSSSSRRRNKNRNRNKKNKKKNRFTTTSTTTTTPAPPTTTSNPLSTPEPPTTPDPGVDFECKDDGFFPHPRECKKYFWCLEAPGLGLVAHHFTCPAGLFFNKNTDSCDYARNVACKDKKATTTTATTAAPTTTTTTTRTTTRPTTRTTTTTTTTPPPEEDDEEYDDDEEYEDDEEEEPPKKEVFTNSRFSPSNRPSGSSNSESNNGRSVKEINDIKDLLRLIRKLGGVEELEKYLDENPSVAAAIKEVEDEEEEDEKEKPASKKSSILTRNRFSQSTNTRPRFGSSSSKSSTGPVAAGSLKYTTIQRSRPTTTRSTTSKPEKDEEQDSEEQEEEANKESSEDQEEDPSPPSKIKKGTSSRYSTSSRPKYVTLSRTSKQKKTDDVDIISTSTSPSTTTSTNTATPGPESTTTRTTSITTSTSSSTSSSPSTSSTETSIVVRLSKDEKKILDEIIPGKNKTTSDDDTTTDDDSQENERYVQLSRTRTTSKASTTAATTEKPKKQIVEETEEDEGSEEYEGEDDEQGDHQSSSSTTPIPPTTPSPGGNKRRVSIPTRKTNGFSSRTRGTTTISPPTSATSSTSASSTTTSKSPSSGDSSEGGRKARNFNVGTRRSLFQNRNSKVTTDAPTSSSSSSSSGNEESEAREVLDLSTGQEISRRVDTNTNEISPGGGNNNGRQGRTRSRSIASPIYKIRTTTTPPKTTSSSSPQGGSRSRSRYRSTTESSYTSQRYSPSSTSSSSPIIFRRRLKTTKLPITTPTTTTTTTTRKPVTTTTKKPPGKDEEDDAEYYYYYYDEDDEEDPLSSTSFSPSRTDLLFQKSQTQNTNPPPTNTNNNNNNGIFVSSNLGLRAETFTPSTSTAQLQNLNLTTTTGGDRGFAKRNLQVNHHNRPTRLQEVVTRERESSPGKFTLKKSSEPITLSSQQLTSTTTISNNHKWSDRAVVPLSEKIKLKGDGTVECLDKGIFPHPVSCKQFVHCVPSDMKDVAIRAWVYSCPKYLTFDPVGGMCNYDEFANTKRGSACIE